ncbi:hypothetical protein JQX09_15800 [Sulfitobacter pseudonitzschiae]|uniref:Uncharacterized protein n=1 Tax=Pseudosulfitobacter pseudonitzschiae TaxID=1402135 RepID=A0A9Q2RYB3_9RHOB|nr:hypothetical protein [Pseudosulfitobacter pseudonitzschiae]MBM2293493.1 hypothetical protein [Pseudosulfitobacter pseudonitzschiae]MBM2298307.1 hypothetical protein [Pseudosulfitobacter pseudonitzschiae]MBM2303220.1 hypothetical protein [Pseudosulfitobacter pseudonitzschiae]MBM2313004.1 hypothetical protein [Pseudosulfitobacter pseudonitzschiae]MBM2317917.1 hypothetical protein [Pseudosulfitobacter pseudonitzschiae]
MTPHPTPVADTSIGQLLQKFTQGDPQMLSYVADDIDFRIDHFKDETDTSWQVAGTLTGLLSVLERLGTEVFPKGTTALRLDTFALGDGWHLTRFHQRFFYGVRQCEVTSVTQIISHETAGKVDYFRETVTGIQNT